MIASRIDRKLRGAWRREYRGARQRRHGIFLAELAFAALISALLMAVAISLIVASLASYAGNRDHYEDALTLDRLATQLRADARQAADATLIGQPAAETALQLQISPSDRVAYEIEAAGGRAPGCLIGRTRYRGDAIAARETFALQNYWPGAFTLDAAPQAENVSAPAAAGALAPADGVSFAAARSVRLTLARKLASAMPTDTPPNTPADLPADNPAESTRVVSLSGLLGQDRRFEREEK